MKEISMKKKNLKRVVAVNTIFALMMPMTVFAGIGSKRGNGAGGKVDGNGNSGTVIVKPGKKVDEKVDVREGTASASCKQDPDSSTFFPLDFFQHITRDGSHLSFEMRDNNKVLIQIPASVDTCGKFKPQMVQDSESKNVTIMMVNESGKTYGEVIKCLEENKILVDGVVDHEKLEGKQYSEYSYVLDYNFDKEKDVKKTAKVSFGYPKAFQGKDGYPTVFGKDNSVSLPSTLCIEAEKISPEFVYINKGQDVLLKELKDICKSADAQKIAEARRSIGNADALKDIADKIKSELDAGYLAAVKQDVEKLFKEMGKIEERVNKERNSLDESTSKKLAEKYADLVKELDSKFLNPAIFRLDVLMKQRAEMEEGDARNKVDAEIKKLNEDIAMFSKRNPTSFANLYSMMEKYAIVDSAKTIEDIRLKSFLYSKVYAGSDDPKRGKAMSFEDANQRQSNGLTKFERTLNDWTDVYLVAQGNQYPMKRTEQERNQAFQRANTRWNEYQKQEQSNYRKYCTGMFGPSNPIQCQSFMKGVDQRRNQELKRREKDLTYIKGRNDKLNRMSISYGDYQRKEMERGMADQNQYDPWASSYTSYEDSFYDIYPQYNQYSGAPAQPGYEAWRYNMAGGAQQQNPLMMANPYMMQQPMMQQQPMMNGGFAGFTP